MNVRCRFCTELVEETQLKAHLLTKGSSCRAALETVRLLGSGLRPLPKTHSLPPPLSAQLVLEVAMTRAKYDGEPRMDVGYLPVPEEQHWVSRWVEIVVTLWAGPIHIEGAVKQAQRDATLQHVKTYWTSSMKGQIVDAYAEDLRAVRDLLVEKGACLGVPPMLISEFEKLGR